MKEISNEAENANEEYPYKKQRTEDELATSVNICKLHYTRHEWCHKHG